MLPVLSGNHFLTGDFGALPFLAAAILYGSLPRGTELIQPRSAYI